MDDLFRHATLGSIVFYRDPQAALDWLENAFGFVRSMVVTDDTGNLMHAEMRFANAYIIVDSEWAEHIASPLSVARTPSRSICACRATSMVQRARVAGAVILQEPEDQFYGARTYRAIDLEGHMWTFSQTVRHVSEQAAAALSGMKIDGWQQH